MTVRQRTLALLTGLFLIWPVRLSAEEPAEPARCPDCSVVLITLNNLRHDHLSGNGYLRRTSPNLDALMEESLVFENCFGHASWTFPAVVSLYTGLYPYQHGIMHWRDGMTLPESIPTLVDELKKAGYRTGAFTGGFDYDPKVGVTGRFDYQESCAAGDRQIWDFGKLDCALPKALNWVRNLGGRKFFLQVQGYDIHCPFAQSKPTLFDPGYSGNVDFSECLCNLERKEPVTENGQVRYPVTAFTPGGQKPEFTVGERDLAHLVALYDQSILEADGRVGEFLRELEKLVPKEKLVVVVTSEHGDQFGEHGRVMRGGSLRGTFYDSVLHVPLVIRAPGFPPRRIPFLAEHVDLMPTLLELLGLRVPPGISGRSQLPAVEQGLAVRSEVFAGTWHQGPTERMRIESIRTLEWKLIREYAPGGAPGSGDGGERLELYRVASDPGETRDLAAGMPEEARLWRSKLLEWAEPMAGP